MAVRWESLPEPKLFNSLTDFKLNEINDAISATNWYNVYSSSSPMFTYYDSAVTIAKFPTFKGSYSLLNLSATAFAEILRENSSPRYFYHSGNIMNANFDGLRRLLDVEKLIEERPATLNVWAGSKGVLATAHYDTVFNVYVHLIGEKTFRLLPPRNLPELFIGGRYHPHACQSRVFNLSEGCAVAFGFRLFPNLNHSEIENITLQENALRGFSSLAPSCTNHCQSTWDGAVEFALTPGDVLFIPPFWVHEAETVTTSVSVSFWWDAPELDVMDAVYALPLPFEASWTEKVAHLASVKFVSSILIALQTKVDQIFNNDDFCRLNRRRMCHSKPEFVNVFDVWRVATVLLKNRYSKLSCIHLKSASYLF